MKDPQRAWRWKKFAAAARSEDLAKAFEQETLLYEALLFLLTGNLGRLVEKSQQFDCELLM